MSEKALKVIIEEHAQVGLYIASLPDQPGRCAVDPDPYAALGRLVQKYPDIFNIELKGWDDVK